MKTIDRFLFLLAISVLSPLIASLLGACAGVDCPRCNNAATVNERGELINPKDIYIIEFKKGKSVVSKITGERVQTIKSCVRPTIAQIDEGLYELSIVEISRENKGELVKIDGFKKESASKYAEKMDDFYKDYINKLLINVEDIKLISLAANVDTPPYLIGLDVDTVFCVCCKRDRACISEKTIFDKIEIRALGGYRFNAAERIFYPGEYGGVYYDKETFGFGRGGTDFTVGLESAFLWDVTDFFKEYFNIPDRNALHIGPMIGVWPVDGSVFVPISIHPRYTFSYNETNQNLDQCNAWYVFGDLGVPLDPTFNAPVVCDGGKCDDLFSYFYGIGVGRDWWMNRCMDFSIDLGFRVTQTPLPSNEDCEECSNIEGRHPFRKIGQVFLRFGFTW